MVNNMLGEEDLNPWIPSVARKYAYFINDGTNYSA